MSLTPNDVRELDRLAAKRREKLEAMRNDRLAERSSRTRTEGREMTDRELLELAAKAAGMDYYVPGESWDAGAGWNPLIDDGDALRLAVRLNLSPTPFSVSGVTIVSASDRPFTELMIEEEHSGNPYAATRRAIVRAAAEIGRRMP